MLAEAIERRPQIDSSREAPEPNTPNSALSQAGSSQPASDRE
jgi:hypothetical protein